MIELKGISKSFKKDFYSAKFNALKNVSFKINEGDLVGFLGANGAGKTTSLKIILNFIKPDSGTILYSSKVGGTFNSFLKNLGYLPERPYFHANLTGREFAEYMAKLHDLKRSEYVESINKWSQRLGIDHALDRKLQNYSKGMLQRVGFVSCLIHNPSFLILDEPVSGLDPVGRREMKDVMLELNKMGKTIFFSSHIVSDIEEICNDLIVLDKGELIYSGEVNTLLKKESKNISEAIFESTEVEAYEKFGKIDKLSSNNFKITLKSNNSDFLSVLNSKNDRLIKFSELKPTLEEIIYKSDR